MSRRFSLLVICGLLAPMTGAYGQVAAPGLDVLGKTPQAPPVETVENTATDATSEPGDLPATAKLDSIQQLRRAPKVTIGPSPFRQVRDSVEAEIPLAPETLSPQMQRLRSKLLSVLSMQMNKPRYTSRHSPWGIMHAMHAFGVETMVRNDRNQLVNAAGWLAWNKPCRGRTMLYTNSKGEIQLRLGPGYQGHEGQFLALLAQARVKSDFEIRVGTQRFTVQDLVEHEKRTCKPRTELTFKLIGLAHYLGADAEWSNQHGTWNIPRLIDEELRQPVIGAACGGTHRLFGHSYALNRARKGGIAMTDAWKRATDYTLSHQRRAIMLQNRDGSFSTEWFKGRGMSTDPERRLQTTGHILEWMVFSLPQVDLQDARIVRSVEYLANLMLRNRNREWEVGPRGHAIRALALYDQRVFGGQPGQLDRRLAELVPNHTTVR